MRWMQWAVAVLAMGGWAWAAPIAVGQFSIAYPLAESVGYYGFSVSNLTGGACGAGYPVCTPLDFTHAQLTVQYGYALIVDDGSGNGVIAGPVTDTGTYTATAQDADAFDASYNNCGVYGVDSGCAGQDDTADAFQLALPFQEGNGETLVILSARFSADSAPTVTGLGTLSGPYTAVLQPLSDGGALNFFDGTSWEYYDSADITTPAPGGSPVPEPGSVWLLATGLAALGWAGAKRGAWRQQRAGH